MKRYWYFASTLSSFPFGAQPPMSVDEFDQLCARFVDKDDMALVEIVGNARAGERSDLTSKSPFLRSYFEFERGLRNALVFFRARANRWDPSAWLRPGDVGAEAMQAAQTIQSATDPLQGELAFERERWSEIEKLVALSSFDLDSILAYKMKLLIAVRCASFDRERGTEGFSLLYKDILSDAADAASIALDTGVPT